MRGHYLLFVGLVACAGCAGGGGAPDAVPCGVGELTCDGTCVDPLINHDHCGTCENACAAEQECRAGQCEVPCRLSLSSPVTDDRGIEWDGVVRTAATLADAQAACEGFSGRLPTVAELYRNRSGQVGAIGASTDVDTLWSGTPNGRDDQVTVKLADGAIAGVPAATPTPYRCVCATSQPAYFAGSRCNGPKGNECYAVGRLNLDDRDRPALRKSAAIWECAQDHAHLADLPTLVEASQKGVLGSGANIFTADQASHTASMTMHWTTATWAGTDVATLDTSTPAPFRCAGWSFATGTHPNTVAGEFVGPLGGYKGEISDNATDGWAAAHDACTARGGHLARSTELAELVMAGLPSGTNTNLWTADQTGYDGAAQFLTSALKWTAVDTRFPYDYPTTTTITWVYKTGTQPFRCIYYPIDPAYAAPTTCAGGCFTVTLPGATPGRMWFDSVDRPVSLIAAAIDTCRREGGHLASERDYTEAVRAGLPNGTSPAWLLTSDYGQGNVHVVHWTGAEPAYTDQYSTYMTWAGPANPYGFRCMWTNELR